MRGHLARSACEAAGRPAAEAAAGRRSRSSVPTGGEAHQLRLVNHSLVAYVLVYSYPRGVGFNPVLPRGAQNTAGPWCCAAGIFGPAPLH